MKSVFLTPAARAELEGAAEWYESRSKGLGQRFATAVGQALHHIGEAPSGFPRWDYDTRFRKFVMQRFPYLVFYRDLPDRIEVIALAHGAREPGYWRKRK